MKSKSADSLKQFDSATQEEVRDFAKELEADAWKAYTGTVERTVRSVEAFQTYAVASSTLLATYEQDASTKHATARVLGPHESEIRFVYPYATRPATDATVRRLVEEVNERRQKRKEAKEGMADGITRDATHHERS